VNREGSIEIDAPATKVWKVFSDIARWPEWTESVERVVPQDGPDVRVGAHFAIKQPRLPLTARHPHRSAELRGSGRHGVSADAAVTPRGHDHPEGRTS